MSDYDPAKVAIRPAATVMLVDDRPDLQVLMMQRHANTVFAGGMWVFPGGSVDAANPACRRLREPYQSSWSPPSPATR